MSVAIRIENVSKLYRLGTVGTGTIAHDLNRWWHTIRGKEDPYAKVGQVNDRTKRAASIEHHDATISTSPTARLSSRDSIPDYIWALRDINLELQVGEILGIIGANGAGKSTLLKLISRVTSPSTGRILAKGRIASLLEVGTGMHDELTARENIFLNGSILGMRKTEIVKKFDEIISFAGCQLYVDTPVKRFSSGMRVRLGFAVAAFLEPEVLIVDEVLAVGDAEFQDRALGKIQEVSQGSGRTVIFVSHQLDSIRRICKSVAYMKNGIVLTRGPTDVVIQQYLDNHLARNSSKIQASPGACTDVNLFVNQKKPDEYHLWDLDQPLLMTFEIIFREPVRCPRVDLGFYRSDGSKMVAMRSDQMMNEFVSECKTKWLLHISIERAGINNCSGYVDVGISENSTKTYSVLWKHAWTFEASSTRMRGLLPGTSVGAIATCIVGGTGI